MIVRVIFVETTLPVRIRPRIEMLPVNGHFLSVYEHPAVGGGIGDEHTNIGAMNCLWWCFES